MPGMTNIERNNEIDFIVGPESLEQFLDMDERLRNEFILAAEDEMVKIEDLNINMEHNPEAVFLLGYAKKMMEENEHELHEIEIARSGLRLGIKYAAVELLKRRIEQCKFMVKEHIKSGQRERAGEMDKQRVLLEMLLEDQVE